MTNEPITVEGLAKVLTMARSHCGDNTPWEPSASRYVVLAVLNRLREPDEETLLAAVMDHPHPQSFVSAKASITAAIDHIIATGADK